MIYSRGSYQALARAWTLVKCRQGIRAEAAKFTPNPIPRATDVTGFTLRIDMEMCNCLCSRLIQLIFSKASAH